jgi:uncharacterized RDD family membrane protein YckC
MKAEPDRSRPRRPVRLVPAGIVSRSVATVIDMIVFLALSFAIMWPAIRAIDWAVASSGVDRLAEAVTEPQRAEHLAAAAGMWISLWWAYFAVGWGLLGATPGKWVVGLRVIDYEGRCPIGFARSMLRLVAYSVSSLTLGVGHLVIVFRADHRALHDILAGTQVVRCRRAPRLGVESGSGPTFRTPEDDSGCSS